MSAHYEDRTDWCHDTSGINRVSGEGPLSIEPLLSENTAASPDTNSVPRTPDHPGALIQLHDDINHYQTGTR